MPTGEEDNARDDERKEEKKKNINERDGKMPLTKTVLIQIFNALRQWKIISWVKIVFRVYVRSVYPWNALESDSIVIARWLGRKKSCILAVAGFLMANDGCQTHFARHNISGQLSWLAQINFGFCVVWCYFIVSFTHFLHFYSLWWSEAQLNAMNSVSLSLSVCRISFTDAAHAFSAKSRCVYIIYHFHCVCWTFVCSIVCWSFFPCLCASRMHSR